MWNKNYHLACTKVIGFVACRVISKIIGIGSSGISWGDVRTIKSGKRSIIRSDVSDKHIIVYISICIESDRNGKTGYESNINGCHTRHIWNDHDEVFDHQLEQWSTYKFVPDKTESVLREWRIHILSIGKRKSLRKYIEYTVQSTWPNMMVWIYMMRI